VANRPSPPARTLHWSATCQSLGREGELAFHCCRCGLRLALELPAMGFGESASTIGSACPSCNTGFSVTLCSPAAVRPPIAPVPKGAWVVAAPSEATPNNQPTTTQYIDSGLLEDGSHG